jgi:uncharacterized Zn finger protein
MPRYFDDDEYFNFDFPRHVSVRELRSKSQREAAKLKNASPVIIEGSRIAATFWGKSWCENLERYSDYANRLPRGRSYVRNGCVVDLQIGAGEVEALVSGSTLYEVTISVAPVPQKQWKTVCHDCAGAIDSLVELLEGRFSKVTMERLCRQKTGLFPTPRELQCRCSCPDSARLCKHIAAVLYGVGARLDTRPELLFTLRNVNQEDLITNASRRMTQSKSKRLLLQTTDLSELFGIDIAQPKRKRSAGVTKKSQ